MLCPLFYLPIIEELKLPDKLFFCFSSLKVFLQLEGKNMGIVLPDADLTSAVEQVTIGSTSYNGQRCTAIKLVLLHRSIASTFLEKFKQSIAGLKFGLPWAPGVSVTPLPEKNKAIKLLHIFNIICFFLLQRRR